MAKKQTLSAVIMSKNYGHLIEGTLKSVAGWADEIIVIDGFSTDNTLEVCRKYTDKIYQNKWDATKRFCDERNLGIAKSTGDWCLQIDPDERATPEFRKAVSKILESDTPFKAYEFRKKNYFFGHWMRYGGWYHYSRHFFKTKHAHYEGGVHEYLVFEGPIGKIEAPIEHYPFTAFNQFVQRHNGYSSREAAEDFQDHGPLSEKTIQFNLKQKPLKRFFKFYIKKMGFLDGIYGFLFSVLFAWVHFINWAKYWELTRERSLKPEKVS